MICDQEIKGSTGTLKDTQVKEPEEVSSVKEEDTTQSSYSVEKINDIKIPRETRRYLNNNTVNELLCSIEKIGLLNPITITKDKKLIAGFHRIHAFSRLGREEIPCRIVDIDGLKAELAEIDENLMRNEFDYIARGDQLARRKKIYEKLYPETKKGISQAKGMNKSKKGDNVEPDSVPTFVENTAQISGKSKTVIKEELQISNNVIPEAKEILKEKKLPKTNALKLSRMEPEEQKVMVERIKSGEAKNVDEAMFIDYFARKEEEEKQEQIKEEPVPEFPEEEPEVEKEKDFQKKYQEERERKDRQYKENKAKEYINFVKKMIKDYSKYNGFLNIPDYINELSGGNHKNDIYGLYREIAQKIREINTAIISIDTLFKNSER